MSSPTTLLLAPIRGVTNHAFRQHFAQCFGGFGAAIAPYVVVERGDLPHERQLSDAFPARNQALPTVPQLLTNDPEGFVDVARALFDQGCDEVNWNLGCPYPMVTRRRQGAGLLPHPTVIDELLDRACSALGSRVSIKMRLGMEDEAEAGPVLDVLGRYPLREVIVHPRTANQLYRGHADVEAFARCLSRSRHSLTYNGDIASVSDYRTLASRLPSVTRWMIGRGALSNPFLPTAIMAGADRVTPDTAALERFHDAMLEHYRSKLSGSAHVLHKMKELWGYLAKSFDPKSKAVKKAMRAKDLDVHLRHVRNVFDGAARWVA